jgi:hypothetical protein
MNPVLEIVKAYIFVKHIEEHLADPEYNICKNAKVKCKLCNKTIDQIWNEYRQDQKLRNQTV